jgi:hypothetical protein
MQIRSVMGGLAAAGVLFASPALAVEAQQVAERPRVGLDVRLGLGGMTGEGSQAAETPREGALHG